jgi:Holliday junction resolvase RusA-like endonuclease
MVLEITVVGTPKPQGSHRAFVNPKTGRAIVTDDNTKTKTWKQDVRAAAIDALAGRPPMEGAVEVTIAFSMPRPGYHFGRRGGQSYLKPTAPMYVEKKPDIDKLIRSTLDALTEARVFKDDAQVASLNVVKGYATDPQKPGAHLMVVPLLDATPSAAARVGQVLESEQGVLL